MTAPPIRTAGATVWTCDACGDRFAWKEQSVWYGSLQEVDTGRWSRIKVYCGGCGVTADSVGAK